MPWLVSLADSATDILSWSWKGWRQAYNEDSIYLFLEGFAAPDSNGESDDCSRNSEYGKQLIQSYRHRGAEFVGSLRGSFAVVLWDAGQRKLILATDHFGTRPIYYMTLGSRFAFASRIIWFAA